MKYEIRVYKIETVKPDDRLHMLGMESEKNYDRQIFSADMTSDNTIEILQHLHHLNSRKLLD
tara:strand:- start:1707 stop:1892 length:186 start_codon:yes stop_codon:yes gene_type:complete